MRFVLKSLIWAVLAFELILVLLVSLNPMAGAHPDKAADAAVVFFADFGNQNGLNSESLRRATLGVNLVKENLVSKILFVGGNRPSRTYSGSNLMKEFSISIGAAEEDLIVEMISRDTRTNWKSAERVIEENKWNRVIIVSSPGHLFRIKNAVLTNPLNIGFAATDPGFFRRVVQAHHEVIAWIAYMLPDSIYELIIGFIRS